MYNALYSVVKRDYSVGICTTPLPHSGDVFIPIAFYLPEMLSPLSLSVAQILARPIEVQESLYHTCQTNIWDFKLFY